MRKKNIQNFRVSKYLFKNLSLITRENDNLNLGQLKYSAPKKTTLLRK